MPLKYNYFDNSLKHFILNEKHEVVETDLMTWARWLESDGRKVARDEINGFQVSTVFLGSDIGFRKPALFETMIFVTEGMKNEFLDYQMRYSTWDEAVQGHENACELVKALTSHTGSKPVIEKIELIRGKRKLDF